MTFNSGRIINQLEQNNSLFQALFKGMEQEEFTWKQNDEKWNILQVACHLRDEEKEDFRARLIMALENYRGEFIGIDPESWVEGRNYALEDFKKVTEAFYHERRQSILFLRKLESPNWENTFIHPKLGELTAAFFLANWLAHDHLHLRQIIQIRHQFLQHHSQQDVKYAGLW